MAGELVVREARADDARAIAEVSVASRRWSYRDLVAERDLEALSVEQTTADFADGILTLQLGLVSEFAKRCLEQYAAIVECAAFVNWSRIEIGNRSIVALSFYA